MGSLESKNMNYTVEVLTPVHIGSGQKLLPSEYIFDIKRRRFIRVRMDGLFQSPKFDFERYLSLVNKGHFYLGNHFLELAVKNPQYELDAASSIDELKFNVGRKSGYVLDFIKEGGRPYLPGSSIKGCIRSLLIRKLFREDRKSCEDIINRQLLDIEKRRKKKKAKFFSVPTEQKLAGEPNYSIFRFLQIGDSQPVSQKEMILSYVKVLSLSKSNTYRWKNLGNRANLNQFRDATPIFFEAVKPGTKVCGKIKLDTSLLRGEPAKILNLNPRAIESVKKICFSCNTEAKSIINGEIEFFNNCGFDIGVKENKKLLDLLLRLKENEFLLPMSWGTGYRNKAVGEVINDTLFENIRRTFNLGRINAPFPKTRKIVFEYGKPATICGWTLVRLEGI